MKRILLLITLCVCIGLYYNNWVNKNFVSNDNCADTIVVDSIAYDYDDWVQMQWSVDSGYGKTD